MTTALPFTRVCVLLPRMNDEQAAFHNPAGQGAAWANRLFGTVGLDHIRDFREDITVVVASSELELIEALMWIDRPSRFSPAMGAHIIEGRLNDDDLPLIEPERFQVLDVLEVAMDNVSVADIERVLERLPFNTYRIERGRTAPLSKAEMMGFDWRPELPGLLDHEERAA